VGQTGRTFGIRYSEYTKSLDVIMKVVATLTIRLILVILLIT
jgi:hypothetical protein